MIEATKKKPTTSKYSYKNYKCTKCGRESKHGTNHYGFIYPPCPACRNIEHECLDPVPEGMGIPEKWKIVTLGELCTIKTVRV